MDREWNKSTRLIDLTVGQLEKVIQVSLRDSLPDLPSQPSVSLDEIGGYELAEAITGYSRRTLYQKVWSGKIPHMKPNGVQVYFSRKDLMEWLRNSRKKTDEEIQDLAISLPFKRKLRRK